MATVIAADAAEALREVRPENGRVFTLPELQALVGGYIELVYGWAGELVIVNEDGKRLGLPRNRRATARVRLRPGDYLVGPAVVCTRTELR